MSTTENTNITTVRAYLRDLQNGAVGDALAKFFTTDAIQIELRSRTPGSGWEASMTHSVLEQARAAGHVVKICKVHRRRIKHLLGFIRMN